MTKVKKQTKTAPKSKTDLQCTKVDPRVWEVAIHLAKQDRSRLTILSETEVVVQNPR